MGRSFLSVKLAIAFGVFIAVLVTVHGHVTASVVERAAVQEALHVVEPRGMEVDAVAEEPVACLWRGCPAVLHPLLREPPATGDRRAPRSI
jgi:hypothetical protein